MNRRLMTHALATVALVLAAGPSLAQEKPAADPKAPLFGNTVTLDIFPLWSAKLYYEPDRTFRQVDSEGVVKRGTWTIENGQICTTETQPAGPTYCHPNVARKVGDTWTNYDPFLAMTIQVALVAGRS